jgi:hypothetical protein
MFQFHYGFNALLITYPKAPAWLSYKYYDKRSYQNNGTKPSTTPLK